MAVWKAEHFGDDTPLTRVWGSLLRTASRRRTQIVMVLTGAALMAAAGALAGSQLQLDDLELRPVRGPRLRVSPTAAAAAVKLASLSREAASDRPQAC